MDFNKEICFLAPEAYETAIPRVTTGVCELLRELQTLAPWVEASGDRVQWFIHFMAVARSLRDDVCCPNSVYLVNYITHYMDIH